MRTIEEQAAWLQRLSHRAKRPVRSMGSDALRSARHGVDPFADRLDFAGIIQRNLEHVAIALGDRWLSFIALTATLMRWPAALPFCANAIRPLRGSKST